MDALREVRAYDLAQKRSSSKSPYFGPASERASRMASQQCAAERIINKLREADVKLARSTTLKQVGFQDALPTLVVGAQSLARI